MPEDKIHCSYCAGTNTIVVHATLDERYPLVSCSTCGKRTPGIRADIFNRREWEARKDAAAYQRDVRLHGLRPATPEENKAVKTSGQVVK